uniref:Aminopeptidase n=1 Tax=Panagrellus redivivus TaxID=6233 RepID=A0A7E4V6F9_PANRE
MSCYKLNSDEFVTMLKAQRPGFKLFISADSNLADSDLYFTEVRQFLNQKLCPSDLMKENCPNVCISYNDETYFWNLPSQ